jgi:parallel beta-helix repeat protein
VSGTITISSADLLNAVYPQLKSQITKEPEVAGQGYSYIIWTDGTKYYAKNGQTGQIEFSGTDASTVIQSAIDALPNGGKIFIKAGTYPATFSLRSNIILEGEGYATIINGTINVIGSSSSRLLRVAIKNLHITGRSNGIIAQYVNQLKIIDCVFDGSLTDAISITYADQFVIERCLIHGVTGNGIYLGGAKISDISNGVIRDSYIYDSGSDGINAQYCDSVRFEALTLNNNNADGLYIGNSMNVFIDGVVADGNKGRGIYLNNVFTFKIERSYVGISHGPAGVVLENCRTGTVNLIAVANDYAGIYIYGGSDIVLSNCQALNNNGLNSANFWQNGGIILDNYATRITIQSSISKNTADYPQQYQAYGIYNINGKDVMIKNCILDGNTIAPLGGSTSGVIIKDSYGYNPQATTTVSIDANATTTIGSYPYPVQVILSAPSNAIGVSLTRAGTSMELPIQSTYYLYPGDTLSITEGATAQTAYVIPL